MLSTVLATKKIGLIVVCNILFIPLLTGYICASQNIPPSPTPFPAHRTVISQTLPLREIWRVKSGKIDQDAWVWTERGVVYATQQDKQNYLFLLNDKNGQPLWQEKYGEDYTATSLVVGDGYLYLTELTRIYAHRLSDGQQVWQFDTKAGHRGHYLYFGNGRLFEYERPAREGNIIRHFDPQTGTLIGTELLPPGELFIQALLETVYLGEVEDRLWAIARGTNKVLWDLSPRPRGLVEILGPPVQVDDLLVLTNDWDLLVLKFETGEVLWQQADIRSNPVVLDNQVYVIATDGSLRSYDLRGGQEIGRVQLDPPTTPDGNYGNYALQLNPRDRIIYAYYGDSEEIIAFDQ